jgi:hypothetical protein
MIRGSGTWQGTLGFNEEQMIVVWPPPNPHAQLADHGCEPGREPHPRDGDDLRLWRLAPRFRIRRSCSGVLTLYDPDGVPLWDSEAGRDLRRQQKHSGSELQGPEAAQEEQGEVAEAAPTPGLTTGDLTFQLDRLVELGKELEHYEAGSRQIKGDIKECRDRITA